MAVTGYTKAGADTAISTAVGTEQTRAQAAESAINNSLANKADLSNGKLLTSQIPKISTFETVTVTNAAARKALTSSDIQPGDIAIQSSDGKRFILSATDTSLDSSWIEVPVVGSGVTSINSQTGAVVLGAADVGADAAGAATTAQSNAKTYTDNSITAEVNRANAAYSKVTSNGDGTWTAT